MNETPKCPECNEHTMLVDDYHYPEYRALMIHLSGWDKGFLCVKCRKVIPNEQNP